MPDQETIWIIGASDGIGAALARAYADGGAKVILSARSADRLEQLVHDLGAPAVAIPIDVGRRDSVAKAVADVAGLGRVDRIIHLAALYDPGRVDEIDPDIAAKLVDVNLMGTVHIAQLTPPLLKHGGQLALCGSVAGYFGLPQGQIYSATKAAVANLTESLRVELAGRADVRLISPGFVKTRLTEKNPFDMPGLISPEDAANRIIRGLESRRFEVHFPRRLTLPLKLLSILPYWASLFLTKRLVRDPAPIPSNKVEHP